MVIVNNIVDIDAQLIGKLLKYNKLVTVDKGWLEDTICEYIVRPLFQYTLATALKEQLVLKGLPVLKIIFCSYCQFLLFQTNMAMLEDNSSLHYIYSSAVKVKIGTL